MDSVLPIQTNDPFFARQINLAKHVIKLVKLRIPKDFPDRGVLINECDIALKQLQDFTVGTLREYLKAEDVVPTDNLVDNYLNGFFSPWEGSFALYKKDKKFYHPAEDYYKNNNPTFFTSLVEATETIAKKVPSLKEAQIISLFDMGTQRSVGNFYVADTPAEKEVFRDGGKVVATYLAPYANIEHGSTGVGYNSGDFAASLVKAGFKTSMLATAGLGGLSESAMKQSALLANIVVEPVGVTLTKMGKQWKEVLKQEGRNDTSLTEYARYYANNIDANKALAGVSTGVPKKVVATMTSQIMAKNNFDSYKIVSNNLIEWERHAFDHHFGMSIDKMPANTYERGGQYYHKTLSQLAVELYTINKLTANTHTKLVAYMISVGTFAVEYTATVANTVIIATPVRVVVDGLFDFVHSCSEDYDYCVAEHLAWYNTPLFATIALIAGSASYNKLTMPSYSMSKDLYSHHGYLPHLFVAYSASQLTKELHYFGRKAVQNDFFNAFDRLQLDVKNLGWATVEVFLDNKVFPATNFFFLVSADAYLLTHEYAYEYKDVARFNLLFTAIDLMIYNIVIYASEIEYARLGSDLAENAIGLFDHLLHGVKSLAEQAGEMFFDNQEFVAVNFGLLVGANGYLSAHDYKYEYKDVARFNLLFIAISSMTYNLANYASEIEYAKLGNDLAENAIGLIDPLLHVGGQLGEYVSEFICNQFGVFCSETLEPLGHSDHFARATGGIDNDAYLRYSEEINEEYSIQMSEQQTRAHDWDDV